MDRKFVNFDTNKQHNVLHLSMYISYSKTPNLPTLSTRDNFGY